MIEVNERKVMEEAVLFENADREAFSYDTELDGRFTVFIGKEANENGYFSEIYYEALVGEMEFFIGIVKKADNYEDAKLLMLYDYSQFIQSGYFNDMIKQYNLRHL